MPTSGIRVLVFGRPYASPDHHVTIAERAQDILPKIAALDPDVIVTSGPNPGILTTSSYALRRRWIAVAEDATDAAVSAAIDSCYSTNLHAPSVGPSLVSVYTPTHNTGSYLREAYDSLRAQVYPDWEWVVVDDASTDGTWDELLAIARGDHRVRAHRLARPDGRIGSLKGIATRLARGSVLLELDHDDLLTEDCLGEVVAAFEDPEVGFVYGNCACVFEDWTPHQFGDDFWKPRYRPVTWRGRELLECRSPDIYDRYGERADQQFFGMLTVGANHPRAFRASVFREIGGYNDQLPIADDLDLMIRVVLHSKAARIDKMLYVYRYRDRWANTTFVRNKAIQDNVAAVQAHYAAELEAFNARRIAEGWASSPPPSKALAEQPCFVVAVRDEAAGWAVKERLAGHDVCTVISKSIFEAYEEGRQFFKDRRRVIYVHDDVDFLDLPLFLETVRGLPPGLHGVVGSAAPGARTSDKPWWDSPPLVGRVTQVLPTHTQVLDFSDTAVSHDAEWLDGLCLVAVGQQWSWALPGDPPLWHGYDWLACERTRKAGGKCRTIVQPPKPAVPLLAHRGHGRTEGLDEAMRTVRALSRPVEERRDYPNIHEHLPTLRELARGVVLELGSRDGTSTGVLLEGVVEHGGEVWSVDIDPQYADAWRGHPRWHFGACDSCNVPALREAGLPEQLDVVFIDSDHTYDRTRNELDAWLPRVRPGGVVILHDTESFPDVKKALLEVVRERGLKVELKTNCNGLGIIRLPSTAGVAFLDMARSAPDPGASMLAVSSTPSGSSKHVSKQMPPAHYTVADLSFVVLDAGAGVVRRCIESIRKFAPGAEIVLVGNGVAPATGLVTPDRVLHLEDNVGFSAGCNRGAALITRPILCFMNDDARFVDAKTPQRLVETINYGADIVGPYSNRAKPPQGDVSLEDRAPAGVNTDESMVVGMCMVLRAKLFRELGGFDPRLLTYDDDDLCRRARQLGCEIAVVGGAWVDHDRHATFRHLGIDPQVVMDQNRAKYAAKWPTIRVVCLAKDEEGSIAGFLDQFDGVECSKHVLLDSATTDATKRVAEARGAEVAARQFTDFADARDFAETRFTSPGDWVIALDPDERLSPQFVKYLPELLATTKHDVLLAPLTAVYPDGTRKSFVPKPFAYRRSDRLKWQFKVHEKLCGKVSYALVQNAEIEHVIALHEDGRRRRAEGLYQKLQVEERYFTDRLYHTAVRAQYPILDYDRVDDPRIAKITVGPLVSVIVPTYRRPELLARAVASVLAQDYQPLEVVVVHDGPFLSDPRVTPPVRFHALSRNHGAGGAAPRNFGLSAAAGELIAYLDDDNEWAPDHLSSIVTKMSAEKVRWGFSDMRVLGHHLPMRFELGHLDTSCVVHERSLLAERGYWRSREEDGYAHDFKFFERIGADIDHVHTDRPTLLYNAESSGQLAYLKGLVSVEGKKLLP